jgi:alkyl sulfatase BDS1-like metallo-beta-lactamase superfamily hydrolase
MTERTQAIPPVAALIRAGQNQTEAEVIQDFIYMLHDVSNCYLVKTSAGDVLVNSGFVPSAQRNQKLLAPHREGDIHSIFLTQAHPDHYGGVPAFQTPNTRVITGARFTETRNYFAMLDDYLRGRSGKIWKTTLEQRNLDIPIVEHTHTVTQRETFTIGERDFEVISTPGGESPCSVIVWLPKEKTVFTGNLFGPILDSVPNLCTTRGDKLRSAKLYMEGVKTVLDLQPETLITGHGQPVFGASEIQTRLQRMHDAVKYIHDETVKGMNAGKTVESLMAEIVLPEELKLGEFHGKVNWAVKSIWNEYTGWFYMRSTTELYATHHSDIDRDLVELAGIDKLVERGMRYHQQGDHLKALHFVDIALNSEADHHGAITLKHGIISKLLDDSGYQNMSEVMWLRGQLAECEAILHS